MYASSLFRLPIFTVNKGRLSAGQPYMCCANNHEGGLSVHWTGHRYNMKTGRIVCSFQHSGHSSQPWNPSDFVPCRGQLNVYTLLFSGDSNCWLGWGMVCVCVYFGARVGFFRCCCSCFCCCAEISLGVLESYLRMLVFCARNLNLAVALSRLLLIKSVTTVYFSVIWLY
jgi:hypothetical protein